MRIQSTARGFNSKEHSALSALAARKDADAAVDIELMPREETIEKEIVTIEPGLQVAPLAINAAKPPALRLRNGVISATTGVLNFADLGLEKYAESVHESAEVPLDVLITILSTGKAISTFQEQGFSSWNTVIDMTGAGASAFASLGHFFPQLQPYADGAKLIRYILQSGQGVHEAVLAVREL